MIAWTARLTAAPSRPRRGWPNTLPGTSKRPGETATGPVAFAPDTQTLEAIIDTAFWASLRREEGYSPKISLAFLPPSRPSAH